MRFSRPSFQGKPFLPHRIRDVHRKPGRRLHLRGRHLHGNAPLRKGQAGRGALSAQEVEPPVSRHFFAKAADGVRYGRSGVQRDGRSLGGERRADYAADILGRRDCQEDRGRCDACRPGVGYAVQRNVHIGGRLRDIRRRTAAGRGGDVRRRVRFVPLPAQRLFNI